MTGKNLPDLQSMSERELVAHGEKAAVTMWHPERERVKDEWARRGKPHMVKRQEEQEAKYDNLSGGLL